jgi:hypothetical protein
MARLTLGSILFHWSAEEKCDFYARIADEAPVDTVYLGEVICSKRTPFFDQHLPRVIERLERGGNPCPLPSVYELDEASSLCGVSLSAYLNVILASPLADSSHG